MSWSLRGVDEETREAVIEAARQSGLSVGEWLKSVITEDENIAPLRLPRPSEPEPRRDHDAALAAAVGRLRQRLGDTKIGTRQRPTATARKAEPDVLSALINDITRELDTDEEARSQIEGQGARPKGRSEEPDAVSDAVKNLEQQIADLNLKIAAPTPTNDQKSGLEEVRDSLDGLLARAPRKGRSAAASPTTSVGTTRAELDARIGATRRQMASPSRSAPAVSPARSPDRLKTGLAEITSRLGPAPADQRKRAAAGGDLATAIAEISERQRRLDENVEAKRDEKAFAAAVETLRGDIANLSQRVSEIKRADADASAARSGLAERIQALAANLPNDRKLLDAIRTDLSVVRTALADAARRATRDDSPERQRLDALRQDIAALRQSLEEGEDRPTLARLEMKLTELARATEASLKARGLEPEGFAVLRARLEDLRRSVESLQRPTGSAASADAALARLDTRLNHIASRVDQLLERTAPAEGLDALKTELASLRSELATDARATSNRLEAQIRNLAERFDKASRTNGIDRPLAALKAQIAGIAEQIGRVLPLSRTVQKVEERLSQIQARLGDGSSSQAIEAARSAAREAAREVSASREAESQLIQSLTDDLDRLRVAADAGDPFEESQAEGGNETLTQVVRRLAQLERDTLEHAVAEDGAPPVPNANRAAAAAWNAAYRGAPTSAATNASPTIPKTDIAALRELVAGGNPSGPRGSDRRGDFIAAARRAAQAAEATVSRGEQAEPTRSSAFTRISEAIRSRKGSLLVVAGATALALGALQLYRSSAVKEGVEQSLIAPATADRGDATIIAPAERASAVPDRSALVALPGAPDAAVAFAEPIRFDNHFGGLVIPSPGGFTGSQAASAPNSEMTALLSDAAAAPWPDAQALARAAAKGDADAAVAIAVRYASAGNPDDLAHAASWYERAAVAGNAVAQYRIASLYERGQGVRQDVARAIAWYRRAAEQGNVEAMHNLAVLLSDGRNGKSDEALTWFLAAANHGVTDSQYNLGVIYGRGIGVTRDLAESFRWFAIAAARGDADAANRRDQIGAGLPSRTIAEMLLAADNWRPVPPVVAANETIPQQADEKGDGLVKADRQALVRTIQTLLAEQGYDPGPSDGVEGPQTEQAIRAYQRTVGLSETGKIDGNLVTALADTGS